MRRALVGAAALVLAAVAAFTLLVLAYAVVNVVILGNGHRGARHGSGGLWAALALIAVNSVVFALAARAVARRAM